MTPESNFQPDGTPGDVRSYVDAEYIVKQLGKMTAAQKTELVQDLAQAFWQATRGFALPDAKQFVTQRYLHNGAEVTTNATGTVVGLTGGKGQFDIVNLIGGAAYIDSATNARQIDFTVGGGSDCLFDGLVSTCFATVAGFTEGQSFTSLSGCTFKGFSTVNGAQVQMTTDYPVNQTIIPVIAICGGTYSETNMTYAARQHWIGSGRKRTIIGSTSANITTNTINMTGSVSGGAVLYLKDLTIQAATGSGGSAGGLKTNTSTTVWAENCEFASTGTTAARAGILSTGTTIKFFATHCTFSGGFGASVSGNNCATYAENCEVTASTGFQVSEDSLIGNCIFTSSTTGVNVSAVIGRIKVHDCTFSGCGTGIGGTGGTASNGLDFLDNTFDTCTLGIDLSALGTIASDNNEIAGNKFYGTGTPITWPSSANLPGLCHDNTSDINVGNTSGTRPFGMICWHNYGYGGVPWADTTKWDTGTISLVGQHATFSAQLDTPAFYVWFGSTRVSVAATNHTYAGAGTYYVSVNSSGTVAFEGGSFPATEFPLAIVTVVAGPRITTIDWYDGFLRTTGSGAVGAPSDSAFVTIGNDSNLSAERALTPVSAYTSVGGVGAIDAGANSTVTLTLKDLTANWTQAGVFDISTAGNLTVLKHAAIGATSVIDASSLLYLAETSTASGLGAAFYGIQMTPTRHLTAGDVGSLYGASFSGIINGAFADTGINYGISAQLVRSNAGTSADFRDYYAQNIINTGATVTNSYGLYLDNATGSGTLTNQYGIYIAALTKGGTLNIPIRSLGGASRHVGSFSIGADATPSASAILDLTNAANLGLLLPNIANASQPSGTDGLIYYDTTKKAIYAYEDNQSASSTYQALHGIRDINVLISGGGSAIALNTIALVSESFAGSILAWSLTMVDNAADSMTVDILTASDAASAGAISYSSIVGAGTKPFVSSAVASGPVAPASWTSVAIAAKTLIQVKVTSAPSTTTAALLHLKVKCV